MTRKSDEVLWFGRWDLPRVEVSPLLLRKIRFVENMGSLNC